MSWVEEQIRERERSDQEQMNEALRSVAASVMGRHGRLPGRAGSVGSAVGEILRFFRVEPKELPEPAEENVEEQLDEAMHPHGIMYRRVRLDRGWQRRAIGPMLAFRASDGAAVALIPGRVSGYRYRDPESGKQLRVRGGVSAFREEAYSFSGSLPMKRLTVKDLLLFTGRQLSVRDIVIYLLLTGLMTLFGLLSPLFTRWLFRDVLQSGQIRVLMGLAVFMLCHSVSGVLLSLYRDLYRNRIRVKQSTAVESAVMSRLMHLPVSFFRNYASGDLSQRAVYACSLCSSLFDAVSSAGVGSLFSLVYLGQILVFAPGLLLPSLGITLATALLSLVTARKQRKVSREQMERSVVTGGMTYAAITGIRKIKLAGAEKRMFARWARQYAGEASLAYDPPALLKLSNTVALAISLGGTLLIYALAVGSGIDAADYYAFTAAYAVVSSAFTSLLGIVNTIAGIRPTLEMARPILEAEPELQEGRERVRSLRGAIELNHVSFRYEEAGPDVIRDLSLKVRPGEYVAVVGTTGCGKSTLLRLLLGFETPQKGSITYDRKDLRRLDLSSLRRRIGVVMQDGKLIPGSILSNIIVTAPSLTRKEAWEAAEIAAIADDIRSMPMGMDTMIGEGQSGLSGGQKQRLMIARAVVTRPSVLMFDEATSALDNLTQKRISDAVDALRCTRIVIAHRLSTIRHADRILYLEGGQILEEGTYEELIAKNGAFAALVERQRPETE